MRKLMSRFPRENVKIEKRNHTIIDNVEALFTGEVILIEDVSIPIEEGDYILRTLPNGLTENFFVINNGFMNGSNSIPSHYQIKARKNILPCKNGLHKNGVEEAMVNRQSIEQLLADDIERCSEYFANPNDETGQDLYIKITGRYDGIIENFGNGLYQYYAEQHFYDPEVSGDSLMHNLKTLQNRMLTYQAVHYPPKNTCQTISSRSNDSNKVFIVHGHDNEAKNELALFLERLGLKAIILHEQADEGKTIIEKIEKYSDVGFAVVLYTECDKGCDKKGYPDNAQYRARQNVVFEHGYLIGKLGRNKACALVKGEVEVPSDISGVVYTEMDSHGAWKTQLCKNMKAAGLDIDMNKL